MPEYTNNLRLREITTGEESGTWGDSTNSNLDLIADAFGSGTEGISGTTHTTTMADSPTADEGRALYLKYTGAIGGTNTITLGPNTINKVWIIENATTDSASSGPYSIIIKQGSGATVTIGNGKVAVVYADGAGSGAAVLDAFAGLELSTTLTVGTDASIGDDLSLVSDAAVLNFGVNSDVNLTHVHDTGLLLNGTMQFQFGDSGTYIFQSADGVLDLVSDTEIEINATTIDMNGALDLSGAATVGGILKTDDATDATSTTAAALQSDGGVACVKDAWIGAQLNVAGTGPHAIGGAAVDYVGLRRLGSFTSGGASDFAALNSFEGTLTGASGDTWGLFGSAFQSSVTTQAVSETIATVAQVLIKEPTITVGSGATVTNSAALYIYSAATEATNDYALWVDAGDVRFDGNVGIGVTPTELLHVRELTADKDGIMVDGYGGAWTGGTGKLLHTRATNPETTYYHIYCDSNFDDTSDIKFSVRGDGAITMKSLPTSDPGVAGQLWANSAVVTVSAG